MRVLSRTEILNWTTTCKAAPLYTYRQLFTSGSNDAHEHPAWHIDKPVGFDYSAQEIAPVSRTWNAATGTFFGTL